MEYLFEQSCWVFVPFPEIIFSHATEKEFLSIRPQEGEIRKRALNGKSNESKSGNFEWADRVIQFFTSWIGEREKMCKK